jgi:hypothetical protein
MRRAGESARSEISFCLIFRTLQGDPGHDRPLTRSAWAFTVASEDRSVGPGYTLSATGRIGKLATFVEFLHAVGIRGLSRLFVNRLAREEGGQE